MKLFNAKSIRVFALCLAASVAAIGSVLAAETLTIKIGYSPGGGYDAMGRFVARHIGNYLPGNPAVHVQNVPGAGSLKLAKLMLNNEPKDGSVIALVNPSLAIATVTEPETANFDANTLNWIGSLSDTPSLCYASQSSNIDTADKFFTEDFIVGSTGKTSATYVFAALAKNLFGGNYKVITGFKGGNEVDVAITRGEIQGRCGNSVTSFNNGPVRNSVNVIGYWSLERDPSLPNAEFLLGRIKDEDDLKATKLLIGSLSFHMPLFLPPDTPQATVDAMRAAFVKMVSDPAFLEDAKDNNIEINAKPGETVAQLIKEFTSVSPEVVKRAADLSR